MNRGRAVFLDRDGTLIEDRGFLRQPADVRFIPGAVQALKRLADTFMLFIVTNQNGVGGSAMTLAEVESVNRYVQRVLAGSGVEIAEVYVCPHKRSDNCLCIKPKPYFLEQAARRYALDLSASFVIGDHPHDVEFARNAGAQGIYVLTGHGEKHRGDLAGDAVVASCIKEAVEFICAAEAGRPGGDCSAPLP